MAERSKSSKNWAAEPRPPGRRAADRGVCIYHDMCHETVAGVKQNGINFESHGLTHKILPNLFNDEKHSEISESKKMLEKKLNTHIHAFSFPDGDYDEMCLNVAKDCGYQLAFTTDNGYVEKQQDLFKLNRINIHDNNSKNIPLFYSTILQIFN